jgi:hypothetical protein
MPPITTKLHGAGDYATGCLLLAAPRVLPFADRPATALLQAGGATTLAASAFTDYELGLSRRIPMPVHLINDAAGGAAMLAAAWGLRRRGSGVGNWLPVALLGLGQIAGAALTERVPGDRGPSQPASRPGSAPTAPTAPPSTAPADAPAAPAAGWAADTPRDDAFVAQQEAAAAAEAASIGGHVAHESDDPAMEPVYEAGGGESEGFELAEAELIDNASHFDNNRSPRRDAFAAEAESDRATAVYGEADDELTSEGAEDAEPGAPPR